MTVDPRWDTMFAKNSWWWSTTAVMKSTAVSFHCPLAWAEVRAWSQHRRQ
ncbi:hypothetical protein [Kibdelosporangium philippinense]